MSFHRYIKVSMDVWLIDPNDDPAASGPPDDALAADLAANIKAGKKPKGKGKDHKVHDVTVTSTSSQNTPP